MGKVCEWGLCFNNAGISGFCGIHAGGCKTQKKQPPRDEQAFDPVKKPSHYNSHPSGIACREITRHEPFNIGMAIKYIWRRELKGAFIRDLEKAIECLEDEIKLYKKKEKALD